jgi:uncharacterized protein (DUF433 family)
LTGEVSLPRVNGMNVPVSPELEKKLNEWIARTGQTPEQLLEGALAGDQTSRLAALDWSQCPAVESVPGKMSGAWVLRGTRMPVATIFQSLQNGANLDNILEWYDGLDRDQVKAVIDFAARSLDSPASSR